MAELWKIYESYASLNIFGRIHIINDFSFSLIISLLPGLLLEIPIFHTLR